MSEYSFKTYMKLFKKILVNTIFSSNEVALLCMVYMSCVLTSTYYFNEATIYSSRLAKSLNDAMKFSSLLKSFFYCSLVSLLLKYVPRFIFDYFLQDICRNKFIFYAREYLNEGYIDFHRKTPGDMRYAIFLKAIASPLTANLTVAELPLIIGSVYFFISGLRYDVSKVALFFLALIPCLYLPLTFYYVHKKMKYQTEYFTQQQKVSSRLYDKLLNYEVIKTYNLEDSETQSFYDKLGDQKNAYVSLGKVDSRIQIILNFTLLIPYIIALSFNAFGESYNLEAAIVITLQYSHMQSNLRRVGREYDNLMWFLNQIKFTEAIEPASTENKEKLDGFDTAIECNNFKLMHGEKTILENINCIINKGEKIAVVGPNGTGKSTFVKSLLGFVKTEGDLFFDSKNSKDLDWKSVIRQISYIPQEDFTSNDTILNNLLLGDRNASIDKIIEKSKLFDAHETFSNLEEGYYTHAGPRGNKLSGGQKQKVSLVRAVLKDAPIFILDEATASMDKNYEKVLIKHIFNHLNDKTLIMIVHGKDYLMKFDKLFFMNNGTLEEVGKYNELFERSSNFREFVGEI